MAAAAAVPAPRTALAAATPILKLTIFPSTRFSFSFRGWRGSPIPPDCVREDKWSRKLWSGSTLLSAISL